MQTLSEAEASAIPLAAPKRTRRTFEPSTMFDLLLCGLAALAATFYLTPFRMH